MVNILSILCLMSRRQRQGDQNGATNGAQAHAL
jgi:hypothetical protein